MTLRQSIALRPEHKFQLNYLAKLTDRTISRIVQRLITAEYNRAVKEAVSKEEEESLEPTKS